MEHLREHLDKLLASYSGKKDLREKLETLVSIHPFNEQEFIIAHLLAADVIALKEYLRIRQAYIDRNPYLDLFEKGPTAFGITWAQGLLKQLVPDLIAPNRGTDPDSSQYDFMLDGKIRIEVKASRAVDGSSSEPLIIKALASDSTKRFDMNFQQLKPRYCDVFVWVAVWRDVIRYWVMTSKEVENHKDYSKGQHKGNTGEGQLHITDRNIASFAEFLIPSNKLGEAIRAAHRRQVKK